MTTVFRASVLMILNVADAFTLLVNSHLIVAYMDEGRVSHFVPLRILWIMAKLGWVAPSPPLPLL